MTNRKFPPNYCPDTIREIQEGWHPVITFSNFIDRWGGYPCSGMRSRLTHATFTNVANVDPTSFIITFNFSEFTKYNLQFLPNDVDYTDDFKRSFYGCPESGIIRISVCDEVGDGFRLLDRRCSPINEKEEYNYNANRMISVITGNTVST